GSRRRTSTGPTSSLGRLTTRASRFSSSSGSKGSPDGSGPWTNDGTILTIASGSWHRPARSRPSQRCSGSAPISSRSAVAPVRRRPELAEQLAGDHHPLDLVGALVDLGDLRVAHHPLDRELPGVAIAAEELDGVDRHLHRNIGSEGLCHR